MPTLQRRHFVPDRIATSSSVSVPSLCRAPAFTNRFNSSPIVCHRTFMTVEFSCHASRLKVHMEALKLGQEGQQVFMV